MPCTVYAVMLKMTYGTFCCHFWFMHSIKERNKKPPINVQSHLSPCMFILQTLNEHLAVPLSVLRVLYDMNEQNTDALLMALHEK